MINSYDDAVSVSAQALRLQNEGRLREALKLWRAVVRYDPYFDIGTAFEHIGEILEDLGDQENAEKAYRAAIAHYPGYDIYILNYAGFLYDHGQMRRARLLYDVLRKSGTELAEAIVAERAAGPIAQADRYGSLSDVKLEISDAELHDILGDRSRG